MSFGAGQRLHLIQVGMTIVFSSGFPVIRTNERGVARGDWLHLLRREARTVGTAVELDFERYLCRIDGDRAFTARALGCDHGNVELARIHQGKL